MTDEHEARLLAHVRPKGWRNPEPAPRYDLVVVGGGTAGLVSAAGAAGLGARVALVERARLGGDCLNTGCVPSKALLRSARAAADAAAAASVGAPVSGVSVDPMAVMARVRARRADLAPHDSAARLASLGVDVFFGEARFATPASLAVDDRILRFRRAVIATGSRPVLPDIAGLRDIPYLTSDSFFELPALPRSALVVGAGPVGCEIAQAMARLGARVTLVESAPRVLPREDPDASRLLHAQLVRDGVDVHTDAAVARVESGGAGIVAALGGSRVAADVVLVAAGRMPRVEGLGLDLAGVAFTPHGIEVDDSLRTTNRRIYAAGDVCSPLQFTHAADAMARLVIRNALFPGRVGLRRLVIPRCTYTSPEVAHVGLPPQEPLRGPGDTITIDLGRVDRAVVDDEAQGFVRIRHARGRIRSATIVGPRAGEVVGLITHVMQHGGALADLASTVFPYPTLGTAVRQAADAYQRSRLTPRARRWLRYYFRCWGLLR